MKKVIMITVIAAFTMFGLNSAMAQGCCAKSKANCDKTKCSATPVTKDKAGVKDSLKVFGKCGMCKTRIETTTKKIKGVTDAQWNESTDMLVYTYTGTVNKADISQALNNVGHDTELGKASDKVYNKLPGCCKYRQ